MKQIYIIALIFFPFAGFSQLKVIPENNKDHYVYVEKSMLFVEKDIDLTLNSSEDTKASIYLRDEAQLLQGKTSSSNSGNGLISLFQKGDATNYTYNYWCSPVSDLSDNHSFGNIFYDAQDRTFSLLSKVTSALDGSSNPLTISNVWIYKFSGKEYSDWEYVGNTFDVKPGEGFTMKGVTGKNTEVVIYGIPNNPGAYQRYDFRGRANTGTIVLDLKEGLTLLTGNPYPSALDLNLLLTKNKNSTGIAYFWDSKPIESHYLKDYEGGYGAYSPAAGNEGYVPAVFSKYDESGNILNNTVTGDYYARRYSPIGQGFIVLGGKDGDFTIKNEYRAFVKENSTTSQFKTSKEPPSKNISTLRLNIDFDTYIRQLLLINREDATTNVDWAMDAKNLSPLATDAAFSVNNEDYLIDARPYELADIIPLHIKLAENNNVNFQIITSKIMPEDIFILDTLTHSYHNLQAGDFQLNLEKGDYTRRFFLTFKNLMILLPNPSPVDLIEKYSIFQNNPSSRLEIRIPAPPYPLQIKIYDIMGREIINLEVDKKENYYEIPTHKLSKGVYVVKIERPDGPVVSKKIIISN